MTSGGVRIATTTTLTADQARQVRALVDEASRSDGIAPFSEHALLHLDHVGDPTVHLLAEDSGDSGRIVGYGQLTVTSTDEASAEVAVAIGDRDHGIGTALINEVVTAAGDRTLRIWAHGDLPPARALAARLGFHEVRSLWQMRRALDDSLPDVTVPAGVTVRTFRPGADDATWLALNAAAFAHHPEQGGWTADDLALRMAEPWFDPAGFFIADQGGEMVGFHWTKVHRDDSDENEPIGEVYVVGVSPSFEGRGLGTSLTLVGLQHLREAGLAQVLLYVDADNTPAVRLYERLGFTRVRVDVMYGRDALATAP